MISQVENLMFSHFIVPCSGAATFVEHELI